MQRIFHLFIPFLFLITSVTHAELVTKAAKSPGTWNLHEADIRAVIQTVAQLTGKNFIIDPRVQGKITLISSHAMNPDEMYRVFLSMLQVLNYSAVNAENAIKIIPAMDAKAYGTQTDNPNGNQVVVRVVSVNHVSAAQLVPVLRPLMLDWGSVTAYRPSNSLVLAGFAANINRLVTIIHHLDRANDAKTEVIKIQYADASKLLRVIQSLQSANNNQGKVSNVALAADVRANALLVSGNKINRDHTIALIKQLDTESDAGGNNTRVMRLNYLTAKKIAPTLTKLAQGYQAAEKNTRGTKTAVYGVSIAGNPGISIQAIEDENALVMRGPYSVIQGLVSIVKKLDSRPQEVLVQAIIVRIDETALTKLGIQWGSGDPENTGDDTVSQAFSNGVGYIHDGSIGAIINALNNNGNTDILATPSILVLNNQKALISDGKNIGLYNRSYDDNNEDDSSTPYNTYERQDVALSLAVTPQIAPDNTVKLAIKHENNSLAQDAQNEDPNNPTINTSKIDTAVLVNSGDILVLGGLISNNTTESIQKIPLLGDIPVLGRLFQYKQKAMDKKNLMVFIRPVIINNKKEADVQSMKQYHYVRYQQLRKENHLGLSNKGDYQVLPDRGSNDLIDLPAPFDKQGEE